MRYEISYVNNQGKKLDLVRAPYRMQTTDLLNWLYDYSYTDSTTMGGVINAFTKGVQERECTLTVTASNDQDFCNALNEFCDIVESDIINNTPGKLYINGYYISCYIFATEKEDWESGISEMDCIVKIILEYPMWIREQVDEIRSSEAGLSVDLDYPYDFEHDYYNSLQHRYIINNSSRHCKFGVRIYGPCVNPLLTIDDITVSVRTTLLSGDILTVDPIQKKIIVFRNNGEIDNAFGSRDKQYDIFALLPPGRHAVSTSSSFMYDVITYYERSEPYWSS